MVSFYRMYGLPLALMTLLGSCANELPDSASSTSDTTMGLSPRQGSADCNTYSYNFSIALIRAAKSAVSENNMLNGETLRTICEDIISVWPITEPLTEPPLWWHPCDFDDSLRVPNPHIFISRTLNRFQKVPNGPHKITVINQKTGNSLANALVHDIAIETYFSVNLTDEDLNVLEHELEAQIFDSFSAQVSAQNREKDPSSQAIYEAVQKTFIRRFWATRAKSCVFRMFGTLAPCFAKLTNPNSTLFAPSF